MEEDCMIEDDLQIVEEVLWDDLRAEGPEVVELVGSFRDRCARTYSGADPRVAREMRNLARSPSTDKALDVVRECGPYFQLRNLLEDVDRVRRLRSMARRWIPAPESLESARGPELLRAILLRPPGSPTGAEHGMITRRASGASAPHPSRPCSRSPPR